MSTRRPTGASLAVHGSPDLPNAAPAPPGLILPNEVMADNVSAVTNAGMCPDWIELQDRSSGHRATDKTAMPAQGGGPAAQL